MSEYVVELEHITKKFSKFTAVDDFSVKLQPGKIYGFVGPNGAGKSTTMAMIMGSVIPTSGKASVLGNPVGSKKALDNLGYSPEFTSFYTDMSCAEYLWYMGTLAGLSEADAANRALELIKKFNLVEHANKKVSKFSTGMKKKVSLAQAMIHHPKVLLLDEPTANLDPTSRMDILDTVRELVKDENMTVLISSHVLTELETIIDHVIMINHGKLIMDEEIETAREKFKNGLLLVKTDNNELLLNRLNSNYQCEVDGNNIRITSSQLPQLKREIVKLVYENNLLLDYLTEEELSLDSLYKQALEVKENDANI